MGAYDTAWGIAQVWLRYFSVFYKGMRYYLVSTFIEPVLYMLSFGLGVGALIGVASGDFPPHALLTLLPLAFLASLLFAGVGLAAAGHARNIDQLSYPQYLFVFPMFLFCGVFYPRESLPLPLQYVAWALPLTAVVSVVRTLTLGFPFQPQTVPILLLWLLAAVTISRRAMFRRLVK